MSLLRTEGIFKENITRIVPDVYQITYRAANVFLIAEVKLTLIDTGLSSAAPRILDFIHRLGRRPEELRLIVLTHCHLDHTGGMRQLKKASGARVACHEADIMQDDHPLPYPHSVQKALELRPLAPLRSRWGIAANEVEIKLKGSEILPPLGGLQVVHTPGHTPGSICLLAPKYKLLFAGDTLTRKDELIVPVRRSVSLDTAQVLNSVKNIAGLDFDIVSFGHHQPVMSHARDRIIAWLDRVDYKQTRS
jgi:glyoxylase-like metal-dependent hydrolase (beta-lactamase superfamily II)